MLTERLVTLRMNEDDCKWLENMYGPKWKDRLEQHIHHEVQLRRTDGLKMRKPWDY